MGKKVVKSVFKGVKSVITPVKKLATKVVGGVVGGGGGGGYTTVVQQAPEQTQNYAQEEGSSTEQTATDLKNRGRGGRAIGAKIKRLMATKANKGT